jgi:hypothetical protein
MGRGMNYARTAGDLVLARGQAQANKALAQGQTILPTLVNTGMNTLGSILKVREDEAQRKQEAEKRAFMEQAFQGSKRDDGSYDLFKAANTVAGRYPEEGMEWMKRAGEHQKVQAQAKQEELRAMLAQLTLGSQVISTVVDQATYEASWPHLDAMDPSIRQGIGDTYDPAKIAQLKEMGMTVAERAKAQRDALNLLTDGKVESFAFRYLQTAIDGEDYKRLMADLARMDIPENLLALMPTEWTEDTPRQLAAMSMTAKEKEELELRKGAQASAEGRATETERHNKATEALGWFNAKITRDREDRVAKGGTAPREDPVAKRQADQWFIEARNALDLQAEGKDEYGYPLPEGPISREEYKRRASQIYSDYLVRRGEATPTIPTFPARLEERAGQPANAEPTFVGNVWNAIKRAVRGPQPAEAQPETPPVTASGQPAAGQPPAPATAPAAQPPVTSTRPTAVPGRGSQPTSPPLPPTGSRPQPTAPAAATAPQQPPTPAPKPVTPASLDGLKAQINKVFDNRGLKGEQQQKAIVDAVAKFLREHGFDDGVENINLFLQKNAGALGLVFGNQ